jgi:CubicO group peptidase (beta-lactamase class C family)
VLISAASCAKFAPKDLVNLPVSENRGLLDTSQAKAVFNYAQHFPNWTQLSLCIINGDSEKYVGVQRRNDSLVYIQNSDSVFEIGSITKTFTGTMLAKMILDGKVDPNEPIKNILPLRLRESSRNGIEITLVHLANHTSGLPFEPTNVKDDKEHPFDPYSPYRYYDATRLYDYLSHQLVLQSTPGEKRTYSNLGVGLVGHILTLISGKPYEELLFETVCSPLGMKNTFVTLNDERMRSMVRGRSGEVSQSEHVRYHIFLSCSEDDKEI